MVIEGIEANPSSLIIPSHSINDKLGTRLIALTSDRFEQETMEK